MDIGRSRSGVPLDVGDFLSAAAFGDEDAFGPLVTTCDAQLRRLAVALLGEQGGHESMPEVWQSALAGASSAMVPSDCDPRAWLCGIVVEQARKRGVAVDVRCDEPAPDADRFLPDGHRWAGHWAVPPAEWDRDVDRAHVATVVWSALSALAPATRVVTILRDIDGFPGAAVAQILDTDDATERRLLHAGRTAVRAARESVLVSA